MKKERKLYDVLEEYLKTSPNRRIEVYLRVGQKIFTICNGTGEDLERLLDIELIFSKVHSVIYSLDELTDAVVVLGE